MLFSSIQQSERHNLSQPDKCKLIHNNEPVERLNSTKILGVHFDENLTWITHVNNLIKSSHATLRSLRQFKWFTIIKKKNNGRNTHLFKFKILHSCIQPTTKIFNITYSKDSKYCSWLRVW